ncbi:hypothetical protein ACW7GZ_14690 [Luteimonas sp. A537]
MTQTIAVVLFGVLSFATGAVGQLMYPGLDLSPVDLWTMPVFLLLVFWWYRLDTTQLGYRRTPWLNVGVIAVAVLALPYYFFRSRGLKRGLLATIIMLAVFIGSGLLTFVGQTAARGLQS